MYKSYIKRFLDLIGAILLIFLLLPFFVALTLVLSFYYRGNPFFCQSRPGLNAKVFKVLKFRSMLDIYDQEGRLLPNKDRITSVGRFLRKTSLDEIPQLFNIIKGDMAFIGPRPLFVEYLPYYSTEEQLRHTVRPGITGLAQISGRNFLNWDERLALDVKYVNNISFRLDLFIFYRTINKVFSTSDVSVVPSMKPLNKIREDEN